MQTTLILTGRDVQELLDHRTCFDAVEGAFRARGEGTAAPPAVLSVPVESGGFHVKAGVLGRSRRYFAAKVNGNFPGNPQRRGLPTIQGVVVLADAESGAPLAVMGSGTLTALRTAAASAVAVKYLANADARTLGIVGCGVQAAFHVRAINELRGIAEARVCDRDGARASRFAETVTRELGIPARALGTPREVAEGSDVLVTCTTSHEPILNAGDLPAGAFVAAVGADHPEKVEIAPQLMADSSVVVDVLDQAAAFGDLHHAIEARVMERVRVRSELGDVVAGKKPGRCAESEVIIFDSTGMALQDVAAAAAVYERAVAVGRGREVRLADQEVERALNWRDGFRITW